MNERIDLNSRERDTYLQLVEGNKYRIVTPYPDAIRVGYEDSPDNIQFIDPSGGPMICVGDTILGNVVKHINSDLTIEFE